MQHKRRAIVMTTLLTAALFFTASASAVVNVKFPYKVPANTLRGKMVAHFAEEVAKQTDGDYKITPYPGGQLYAGAGAIDAAQLGTVEMAMEPTDALTGYVEEANLFEVPFSFATPEDYWKFLKSSSADVIFERLKKAGLHPLATLDEGPFVVAARKKLLKTPQDFKGQVIRTSGHEEVIAALHAFGASTVKIAFSDVYSALQQGTVSAVYTTFDAYTTSKLYEVAPYATLFPARGAYVWMVNEKWWDAQPEKDQKIIKDLAVKLADEYNKTIWDNLDDYIALTKEKGKDYYNPADNPEVFAEFQQAVEPVLDNLREKYGKTLVNNLMEGKAFTKDDLKTSD